jgi:hypothetical protein
MIRIRFLRLLRVRIGHVIVLSSLGRGAALPCHAHAYLLNPSSFL